MSTSGPSRPAAPINRPISAGSSSAPASTAAALRPEFREPRLAVALTLLGERHVLGDAFLDREEVGSFEFEGGPRDRGRVLAEFLGELCDGFRFRRAGGFQQRELRFGESHYVRLRTAVC